MSERSSGPFRVLLGDSSTGVSERELLVEDPAELVRLARSGRLTGRSRICVVGSGEWRPASSMPALAGLLHGERDPWAAWDDAASEEPPERDDDPPTDSSLLQLVPLDEIEELPSQAVVPVPEPARPPKLVIQSRPRLVAEPPRESPRLSRMPREPDRPLREPIPLARRRPQASPPLSQAPEDEPSDPSGPVAEVIAFPIRSHSTYGSGALAADPLPLALPRRMEEQIPTGGHTRWLRLLLFAAFLFGGLFLTRWYVKTTSSEDFASTADVAVAPPPPAGMTPSRAEAPGVDAVYAAMEEELRARLMPQSRDVAKDGDLEEALLIELTRQKVDVKRIVARVQTWTGRKGDVPQVADFQIWVNSKPGELDRELAAVGLVVGKYINFYSLEVPLFDVTFEGLGPTPRRQSIDPNAARYFYRQRLSIVDFLTGKVPAKAITPGRAAPSRAN